jgi:regulatory protein YycI of two-component signal transduction system YycFG
MLSVTDVNRARDHCKKFVSTHINSGSEFSLSSTTDNNFILLFVAKCDRYNDAVADAPSNVMFYFEEDLERLYGPTLKGFVSSLEPGHSTWVTAPK